ANARMAARGRSMCVEPRRRPMRPVRPGSDPETFRVGRCFARGASGHLRSARASAENDYRLPMLSWDPTDDDIEGLVIDALEALPAPFRDQLRSVAIVIEHE